MVNNLSIKKRIFLSLITLGMIFGIVGYSYLSYKAISNCYFVEFKSSISGLKVGSFVCYKGVDVGIVDSIKINSKKDLIEIKLKINSDFNMYSDYVATCNIQGVSGIGYVDLSRNFQKDHIKLEPNDFIDSDLSFIEKLQVIVENFLTNENSNNFDVGEFLIDLGASAKNLRKILENAKENQEFFKEEGLSKIISILKESEEISKGLGKTVLGRRFIKR